MSFCSAKSRRRCAPAELARCVWITAVLLLAIFLAAAGESSDGSQDSEDNQVQGYDDNASDGDGWYADDIYMQMIDDAVRQELDAEIEAERSAAQIERETATHELMTNAAHGSVSLLGFASAMFCTAVSLYFIRVDALMRRYSEKGAVVDGLILASVPDIHDAMKQYNQIHDSYSMMTDDESYRMASDSGSDGSGQGSGHGSGHGHESGTTDVETAQRVEIVNVREQHNDAATGINTARASVSKSREKVSDENAMISESTREFNSKSFRVMVQYDDIAYDDEVNEKSAKTIRKQLLVKGDDIIETGGKTSSDLLVKLYVLPDRPKSGHPYGEVDRSLRWEKRISSNIYIMFGAVIVVAGICAAKKVLSPKLFYSYVGLLIVQVPLLSCFLNRSFSKLISERYLDNGASRPSKGWKQYPDDKERIVAALRHGTSFGLEK